MYVYKNIKTCCAAKKSHPSLWRLRAVGGLLRCVSAPSVGDSVDPGAMAGLVRRCMSIYCVCARPRVCVYLSLSLCVCVCVRVRVCVLLFSWVSSVFGAILSPPPPFTHRCAGAGVWKGRGGSCEKSICGANDSLGPALKRLLSISCALLAAVFSSGASSTCSARRGRTRRAQGDGYLESPQPRTKTC